MRHDEQASETRSSSSSEEEYEDPVNISSSSSDGPESPSSLEPEPVEESASSLFRIH